MAGKYGSSSVSVQMDDAQGGTLRTITNYVLTIGEASITSKTEASHAFGDSWEEVLPVGQKSVAPIDIEGHWDTTATSGPHAVMNDPDDDPNGGTRTLTLGFGDSKTWTVEGFLTKYSVVAQVGALTRFKATFTPSGEATWA
jgi:hypothetical protein